MASPLIKALDSDGDGEISASEITNAPTTLKTLDKNNDGKLEADELRPHFGQGGPMGGGPEEGHGGSAMSADEEAKSYLTLDKNGDGKLTKEEVPTRMHGLFTRADENHDGIITREEIGVMVKKRFATIQQRGGSKDSFSGPPPD
jgi:Ca2+-binding EF-hand superfamily protein